MRLLEWTLEEVRSASAHDGIRLQAKSDRPKLSVTPPQPLHLATGRGRYRACVTSISQILTPATCCLHYLPDAQGGNSVV